MPTSTQKGFSVGKWELKYLRKRYFSHRHKVAAAKPAIDSKPPADRPHVQYKRKKGLNEQERQTVIMLENLRILNKTCEIMMGSDYNYYPSQVPKRCKGCLAREPSKKSTKQQQRTISNSLTPSASLAAAGEKLSMKSVGFHQEQIRFRQSQPITLIEKKNTHIILGWFLTKFGKYVPWWSQVTY